MIENYGGIDEINRNAQESSKLDNLISRLEKKNSDYVKDLEWLIEQLENNSFITVDEYRKKILGDKVTNMNFNEDYAVTLEISACQYFPAFMKEARQAIKNKEPLRKPKPSS